VKSESFTLCFTSKVPMTNGPLLGFVAIRFRNVRSSLRDADPSSWRRAGSTARLEVWTPNPELGRKRKRESLAAPLDVQRMGFAAVLPATA